MEDIYAKLAKVRTVDDLPGSGQLRAGVALKRAGISTDFYAGFYGGYHWFRERGTGRILGVDLVTGQGALRVGVAQVPASSIR